MPQVNLRFEQSERTFAHPAGDLPRIKPETGPPEMNYSLGTILPWPVTAREGGLIAYGPDYPDLYRRAASYVDRILKGTKPADLPVEEPTKVVLVVNVKTAKALAPIFPSTVLVAANEFIE